MDRRQRKTRDAIFRAFGRLLQKKRFENITVQEIIDEADIGRSTFYAHFETKDDLLRSMCTDIFHHVFTEELPQEADEDCSAGCKNMELKLGHVLYHLRENKVNLKGLLASESGEQFEMLDNDWLREFMRSPQFDDAKPNNNAQYMESLQKLNSRIRRSRWGSYVPENYKVPEN